jgi:hypothetical protein
MYNLILLKMSEETSPIENVFIKPRVHEQSSVCDFTGDKRAQIYPLDFSKPPLSYAVGPSRAALESFHESVKLYIKEQGWIHFDDVLSMIPSFFDSGRVFQVRRSNKTEIDSGWKLASNWRINWQMNSFRKISGEPWWRVPLEKDLMVRWTFVHELAELNSDMFPSDIWSMILDEILKINTESEPNDLFLTKYSASAWLLTKPSDQLLAGYKL